MSANPTDAAHDQNGPATSTSPDIVGLRPAVTGVYVALRCRCCGHAFESYQPTVAGVAIGRHTCPQCLAMSEVWPEDLEVAFDRHLPAQSLHEVVQLSEEANRVAETWYRVEPFAGLLTYEGINLGEPTEREIVSFVTSGLYAAERSEGHSP